MTVARETIMGWLQRGQEEGATHVIVVRDSFELDDYAVYVMPHEDAREREEYYRRVASNQRVMNVFSLTGTHTIEDQLRELRAYHFD